MKNAIPFLLVALAVPLTAQETVDQRLDRIERENRALRQRIDDLAGTGSAGLTRDASGQEPGHSDMPLGFDKVYGTDDGVSIAGYGEYLFTQNSGRTDVADALRTVFYLGYHFDEKWLFHSEIELEHGSTSAASGTTTSSGSVSVEFSYLEYQASDCFALRAGVVLVPVGLVNEEHEPTRFLPAVRSQTETRIIPTTWREIGIEAVGSFGDTDMRAFVGTGLDGEEFGASGLRSGRQQGNRAAADDIAAALRVDTRCGESLSLGGSIYYQKAGQDGTRNGTTPIPELDTLLAEAHVEWNRGPFRARALWASAFSDDAAAFASATGRNLALRSDGYYGEFGYDLAPCLCPESDAAIIPFVRYEQIDTQAKMAAGIAADPMQDNRIITLGVHVRPTEQIVVKIDFEQWDNSFDRFHIGMGYVF